MTTQKRVTRKMLDAWLEKFRPDLHTEVEGGNRMVRNGEGRTIKYGTKWAHIAEELGAQEVYTQKIEGYDRALEIMSESYYGPEAYAEAAKIIAQEVRNIGGLSFSEVPAILDWLEDAIGLLNPVIDTPEKLLNHWKNHRLKPLFQEK